MKTIKFATPIEAKLDNKDCLILEMRWEGQSINYLVTDHINTHIIGWKEITLRLYALRDLLNRVYTDDRLLVNFIYDYYVNASVKLEYPEFNDTTRSSILYKAYEDGHASGSLECLSYAIELTNWVHQLFQGQK